MTLRLSFLICKRRKPQAGAHWAPGEQHDWEPEPLRTQGPACLTGLLCRWFLLEGGWLGSCTWPASVSFCRLDEGWQGRHLPPLSSRVLSLLTPSYCYCGNWISQAAGKGLEQMACINYDGDTDHSPSIRSHASISETSKISSPAAELCDH